MEETTSHGDMASALSDALGAASPAATSEGTSPTPASASAPATAAPGVPAASTDTPVTTPGPIPFDRHEAALKNAREKAREETLTEWRQQHGWAEQTNREVVEQAVQLGQRYNTDRVGFLTELLQEAIADPNYGPQVLGVAGRILSSQRGQRQAAEQQEPQPDLQAENGSLVYSAQQLRVWHEWNNRNQEAKLQAELQPLKQDAASRAQAVKVAELHQQAAQQATTLLTELRSAPGFKDHEKEIKAAMQADPNLSVEAAYRRLVVPKLSQSERSSVVADLKTKADASTANPAHTSTAPPKSYANMTMAEALRHELAAQRGR